MTVITGNCISLQHSSITHQARIYGRYSRHGWTLQFQIYRNNLILLLWGAKNTLHRKHSTNNPQICKQQQLTVEYRLKILANRKMIYINLKCWDFIKFTRFLSKTYRQIVLKYTTLKILCSITFYHYVRAPLQNVL